MKQDLSHFDFRDSMVNALLKSAYQNDLADFEARFESVMQQIELEQLTTAEGPESTESRHLPQRRKRWMSVVLAASVLIAMIIVVQSTDSSRVAIATVQRSIEAAQEFLARHYRVTVSIRDSDQNLVEINSDLYVHGSDRFALRHPAVLPDASLWLGSDGQVAWLVPAVGPIRIGDGTGLGRWLSQREQLSTPFLHVETILARMKRGYRLEWKSKISIPLENGTTVTCEHVTGTRQGKLIGNAPDRIELWSDSRSGVAIRLVATWNEPVSFFDLKKISLEFADAPELPENWFSAAGHSSPRRRTLHFDSTE